MKRMFILGLFLGLVLCSCDGAPPITYDQHIDEGFGMSCVGAVRGFAAVTFYRCENEEAVCYASYNGSSVSCNWKEKGE